LFTAAILLNQAIQYMRKGHS